ncbi:GAF domain-containing protein [Nocardioides anomalus]|uniref:GAF domain-containing protein n=1 Tax=Nocardioides anomalus TaxID=2712223 RepID=A0A6G6W8J5_9ACTN|nr:ATP-binding protein [Nocardioides anomalus]QIG41529.1 GAF domain-containing protein [Nocardioides anomalus]
MSRPSQAAAPVEPQAPLGHLSRLGFALLGAGGVDEIATSLFRDLGALPGVRRIGFALTEGGGRRLRFTASDRELDEGRADWCHIDAYDDVPITTVVRTGEPVLGARHELDPRYAEFVQRQPEDVRAMAVVPLPGTGSPMGGIVLYLDREWSFDETQRQLLEATARRTAEAVDRVRLAGTRHDDVWDADDNGAVTARMVLHGDTRAPSAARRFVRDVLVEAGASEDLLSTAELCVSELVTNAVLHADSSSELRVVLDTALTVSVRDRGGPAPEAAPDDDPDPLRVHGRGLQLVEALADRWGSERDAVGTTVWFALDLAVDEGAGADSLDETG